MWKCILQQETQEADDAGVLGRVRNVITAGIGWLTTARKRRGGLLASMQGLQKAFERALPIHA